MCTTEGRGFGSCSELGVLCENELLTSNAACVPLIVPVCCVATQAPRGCLAEAAQVQGAAVGSPLPWLSLGQLGAPGSSRESQTVCA